jgi:hypothetical protein
MYRLVLVASILSLLAAPASAQVSFQFSAAGAQTPEALDVDGFRLVLFYGKNQSVSGFDFGIASFSEAVNSSGFSMIWGIGRVTGKSSGLASGFVNIHDSRDTGMNAAFINSVRTMQSGVNLGFVNVTDGYSSTDISGIGIAKRANVQVGFVNIAEKIEGVQIGFLNFAENGIFPFLPFFNMPKSEAR